jgi:hypothetical protein
MSELIHHVAHPKRVSVVLAHDCVVVSIQGLRVLSVVGETAKANHANQVANDIYIHKK